MRATDCLFASTGVALLMLAAACSSDGVPDTTAEAGFGSASVETESASKPGEPEADETSETNEEVEAAEIVALAERDLAVSVEGPASIEVGVPFVVEVTVGTSGLSYGAGLVDVVFDLPVGLESTGSGVCPAGTGQVVCDDVVDTLEDDTSETVLAELVWSGAAGTGLVDVLVGVEDVETQYDAGVPLSEIDADVTNNTTTLTLLVT